MNKDGVGIITFHCADNYGAMLQAYGLKKYLRIQGIQADIIPYAPPFMRGRHWWIPYMPASTWRKCLKQSLREWRENRSLGKAFFRQKRNMNHFRKKYLLEKGSRKLWFPHQLKSLTYPCYIVGSDQIWNPGITCGLREVYFGAFENRYKKKVISYAASLGAASLPPEYDNQFVKLIGQVEAVSVREKEAVPYIQKLYQGAVIPVLDPVFLLKKQAWQKIEKEPKEEDFILVYTTECRQDIYDYAKKLSEQKGLQIIELRIYKAVVQSDWRIDYGAGPAEFLGYLHKAEYVVTNSFHAVAFSVIYQKRFAAFVHKTLGARIENILRVCGLDSRNCQEGQSLDIDLSVDWKGVRQKMEEEIRKSEAFLRKNLPEEVWKFPGTE